ncbi:hypothetical protein A3F66_06750 [candidate division TM6 bacterium RIFCSPHIGHO2_12_FULL_32_22]|nr:MAG: hypothetical protein A3F66_06750 [candidate division TM6 bacterium RIFCSPHIGHO2_12_FULL_32_22]
MSKRPSFDEFKKRVLRDPEAKAAYDLLEPEFAVLRQFIKARKKVRCSQVELAERLDLQQPAIARLERGGYTTTSVGKLAKVADALGYKLKVSLSPKKISITKTKPKKS